MNRYDFLAGCYDEFTTDVGYLPGLTILRLISAAGDCRAKRY